MTDGWGWHKTKPRGKYLHLLLAHLLLAKVKKSIIVEVTEEIVEEIVILRGQ